ncbi:hypothetical protein ElyMa_002450200 [Elysia marginata]|uniref:Uncharacterized protein n=1 Tax=Elysia marginata TaxID=1093978 RepID=A0AAV4GMF3_9GAST|nr:hypothetical protein ElyMa_002450200 [Elysia marginata]
MKDSTAYCCDVSVAVGCTVTDQTRGVINKVLFFSPNIANYHSTYNIQYNTAACCMAAVTYCFSFYVCVYVYGHCYCPLDLTAEGSRCQTSGVAEVKLSSAPHGFAHPGARAECQLLGRDQEHSRFNNGPIVGL